MDISRGYAPWKGAPGDQTAELMGGADIDYHLSQGRTGKEMLAFITANPHKIKSHTARQRIQDLATAEHRSSSGAAAPAAKPGGNPYSSDNGGAGVGAASRGVNFQPGGIAPPPPPRFDTGSNPIIDLAKDRAEEFINDNNGGGDVTVTEKNNSIENNIEQSVGNKGDFIVNNNPIDSDQTYAYIGNDYSMNLNSLNLNNQNYS